MTIQTDLSRVHNRQTSLYEARSLVPASADGAGIGSRFFQGFLTHRSKTLAFTFLASITASFLAGSAAPTPLYAVYQATWGFSPITITIVFGIYALAVLGALLVLGGLSDFVGRRPVLFIAALLQAVAMLIFATAASVSALILARIVQGISAGAAVGAAGAGMLDISRQKGTLANSVPK